MSSLYDVSPELSFRMSKWQRYAAIAGGLLLLVSCLGALAHPEEFFRSYLFGYLFWLGLSLGSLALLMTQYLTGGAWGVVTRRTYEAASRIIPLLVLMFIPIAAAIHRLYPWSHLDVVRADEILRHRSSYMNTPFFLGRTVIYFAIWITLVYFLNRWSHQEDIEGNRLSSLARLSAPGLILYVFTITFSSVDWAQSLFSHWYSTMWGFLFVAGQGVASMAFSIAVMALLSRYPPLSEVLKPAHFQDLGKLLLMFVMLWAYFSFSQLLIVWSGNLTGEIPWYMPRWHTSWAWVGGALICFEFAIPFLLLLSRPLKRDPRKMLALAVFLLGMRLVNLYWMVMPDFYRNGLRLHWLQFTVPLALGGIWISAFFWQLRQYPLLPLHDPSLEGALQHNR